MTHDGVGEANVLGPKCGKDVPADLRGMRDTRYDCEIVAYYYEKAEIP